MAKGTPLERAARSLKGPLAHTAGAPKVAVVVAGELRRRILGGTLAIGSSVTEAELIEEFDISRPTLREALRILEMEQLLTVRRGSHRGSVVRLPDASVTVRSLTTLLHLRGATLQDIYAARTIFEPPAARLAAERATGGDIERLREILDQELDALSTSAATWPIVGWRFHTELVALSGNATLSVMAATLEHVSEHHASRVVARWSQDQAELVSQAGRSHRKLVDLIARRRGAAAETFWREHMRIAGELLFADGTDESIVELLD